MSDVVSAILGGHYKMKECWINVYYHNKKYKYVAHRTEALAEFHQSYTIIYRIHVRMK
jgi:hypothetical protein